MFEKVIMVTGGAGFIGSNLVKYLVNKYPEYQIINFDALTYASNISFLDDIKDKPNYKFVHGDIKRVKDYYIGWDNFMELGVRGVFDTMEEYGVTDIIHLAAESHVDNSIKNPNIFVETNVIGTLNLLNAAKELWADDYSKHRFHHVSTDEVFGALDFDKSHKFTETTPYNPHSPYSASKASSDHFVRAYHDTYGLNITISNCSNNYGPNQHPEKLLPLSIKRLENNERIPIYGDGMNVRDWLYVEDHCRAIDLIFHNGENGESYNVGGNCERDNLAIIEALIRAFNELNWANYEPHEVVEFVKDRAGHDLRYAIDSTKLQVKLGWEPKVSLEEGLKATVKWYMENKR